MFFINSRNPVGTTLCEQRFIFLHIDESLQIVLILFDNWPQLMRSTIPRLRKILIIISAGKSSSFKVDIFLKYLLQSSKFFFSFFSLGAMKNMPVSVGHRAQYKFVICTYLTTNSQSSRRHLASRGSCVYVRSCSHSSLPVHFIYRTRATNRRSRIIAAPSKKHANFCFLFHF